MRQKYHFATDNGILIWDVTSILEDIEQHPDSYTIQTLSTALLADHNDARVSHTRAMASDLTKPLVVAELSKDHLLLIDGNHRLYKARTLGLENIPCYYLSQRQQQHFIVHFRPSEYEHIIACVSLRINCFLSGFLSLTQKPFRASFLLFQSQNGSFYFISFLSISQYVRPCCLSENLPHPM